MNKLDCRDSDGGVCRYSSTEELSMEYLETEENVQYSRTRAAMNVWLGWLADALELEIWCPDQLGLPKTHGRYLLIDRSQLSASEWSQGLPALWARRSRFHFLATRTEGTSLWVCHGNQKFVHYLEKQRKKLAGILDLE